MRYSIVFTALLTFAAMLSPFPSPFAFADDSTADLRALIRSLDDELGSSTLTPAAYARIRRHLEESIAEVRGGSAAALDDQCMALAMEVNEKSFQKAEALEKATVQCAKKTDGKLTRFAYDLYTKQWQPREALARALAIGQDPALFGKEKLVRFAYERLTGQYQPADALAKAATLARTVASDRLSCVERAYDVRKTVDQAEPGLKNSFGLCD